MTKIYCTKYALSKGIEEFEVEDSEISKKLIPIKPYGGYITYLSPGEWHLTKEEAIQRAETLRLNRIKSLEQSIVKVKRLKF